MDNSRLQQLLNYYREDPSDPFILFALAKEHEQRGESAAAIEHYEKLRKEHPEYIGTYYHLAQLYGLMEQPAHAMSVYDEGILKAQEQGDAHALSELKNARLNYELEQGL